MRLAANLTLLYGHLPLEARFDAAARDGFSAVEILFPYDRSPAWYADALRASGLTLALINTPVDDGAGCYGLAALPGEHDAFRAALDRTLEVAAATACPGIHLMAAKIGGLPRDACHAAFVGNLAYAMGLAQQQGVTLMLEPLNQTDVPGYFYQRPEQALTILHEFDSPQLRLQFDYYHCMKEGLDLRCEVTKARGWIGHAQIAGVAGRQEPDLSVGDLYEAVAQLSCDGYVGWLGCEYRPKSTPIDGLVWCEPLREAGILR